MRLSSTKTAPTTHTAGRLLSLSSSADRLARIDGLLSIPGQLEEDSLECRLGRTQLGHLDASLDECAVYLRGPFHRSVEVQRVVVYGHRLDAAEQLADGPGRFRQRVGQHH